MSRENPFLPLQCCEQHSNYTNEFSKKSANRAVCEHRIWSHIMEPVSISKKDILRHPLHMFIIISIHPSI